MPFMYDQNHQISSPKRSAGLVASMLAFKSLCTKKDSRMQRKLKGKSISSKNMSSTASSKRLISTISSKAMSFVHRKKNVEEHEEEGDGGVWQKRILMGGKCQPLDFSGVIYYDCDGQQVNKLPVRSPLCSPLPGYLERK